MTSPQTEEYDWYVRTNCGDGEYSEWAGPATFKTLSEGILWSKCYGGSSEDVVNAMTATPDEGYIIAGRTSSNDGDVSGNHGGSDFWLIKINGSGDTIWTKTYGGSSSDIAYSIKPKINGGYIVAGMSQSHDGDLEGHDYSGNAIWIISINDSGNLIWETIYSNVPVNDHPISILATTDGGYLVSGSPEEHNEEYGLDILLLKLNSGGDVLWSKIHEGPYGFDQRPNSISEMSEGGFFVVGTSYAFASQECILEDGLVLRLNSNGEVLSKQIIGNPECEDFESLKDIYQTLEGGYLTAGYNTAPGYSTDFFIVKLDDQGEIDWSNSLDIYKYEQANSIQQNSDSSFIIAGSSYSSKNFLILKLNKLGELITFKELGGSNAETTKSVLKTEDGGYVVAGYTESSDGDVYGNHGSSDFWVVKLDEEFFNKLNPTTLPYTEDWEAYSGNVKTNDTIHKGEHYNWTFETDVQNQGRVRWGSDAYMSFGGDGALTFDKVVGNGSNASNSATLTLNLC